MSKDGVHRTSKTLDLGERNKLLSQLQNHKAEVAEWKKYFEDSSLTNLTLTQQNAELNGQVKFLLNVNTLYIYIYIH